MAKVGKLIGKIISRSNNGYYIEGRYTIMFLLKLRCYQIHNHFHPLTGTVLGCHRTPTWDGDGVPLDAYTGRYRGGIGRLHGAVWRWYWTPTRDGVEVALDAWMGRFSIYQLSLYR